MVSNYEKYRGKCKEMCEQAVKDDPTLTMKRGWYLCPWWGKQAHWWCVREDGTIHDPTALQFPSGGLGEYVEYDGTVECEYCGEVVEEEKAYTYGRHGYCSYTCACRDVGL